MKIGMRKSSLKKSFKARTTGKLKRQIKKKVIPGYGKKGMGILHPKKLYIIKSIERLHLVEFLVSINHIQENQKLFNMNTMKYF